MSDKPDRTKPVVGADELLRLGAVNRELRAEVERLEAVWKADLAAADGVMIELRAEVERLRDENTRLDALIDRGLFAEIDRLRAALERLKDYVAGQAEFIMTSQGWYPTDGSLALELEAAEAALDRPND